MYSICFCNIHHSLLRKLPEGESQSNKYMQVQFLIPLHTAKQSDKYLNYC